MSLIERDTRNCTLVFCEFFSGPCAVCLGWPLLNRVGMMLDRFGLGSFIGDLSFDSIGTASQLMRQGLRGPLSHWPVSEGSENAIASIPPDPAGATGRSCRPG